MHTLATIPGVTLEVYKQRRQLIPESDGYLGQLYSGFAVILAVIDPGADPTVGLFRDGKDHYILQKDWLNNPRTEAQQQAHHMYLTDRSFVPETKVYGIKIPVRVDQRRTIAAVHYPENMFVLAQYERDHSEQLTGKVRVWKIAVISQGKDFFFTTQLTYDVTGYRSHTGATCFPRLQGHHQLERLLVSRAPADLPFVSDASFNQNPSLATHGLPHRVGVVDDWYDARNMGCIITDRGPARVHWTEIPPRPRRRFLVAGERVRFTELRKPPINPRTKHRKMRKARFELQAYGVEIS